MSQRQGVFCCVCLAAAMKRSGGQRLAGPYSAPGFRPAQGTSPASEKPSLNCDNFLAGHFQIWARRFSARPKDGDETQGTGGCGVQWAAVEHGASSLKRGPDRRRPGVGFHRPYAFASERRLRAAQPGPSGASSAAGRRSRSAGGSAPARARGRSEESLAMPERLENFRRAVSAPPTTPCRAP